MKKVLIGIFAIVFVAIAVAFFSINTIVKGGVEKYGPVITGAPVSLGSATISIFSGNGSLNDLVVGSPKGFKGEHIFKLKKVSVSLDVASLMSDTVIINEIIVDSPDIIYEIGPAGTNISSLLANAKLATEQKELEASSGDNTGNRTKKNVIIKNLKITSGQVQLAAHLINASAGTSVPLPDIQLSDIGAKNGGTSFESAIAQIIAAITKKVASLNISLDQIKNLESGVDGVADKIKGLLGQ